MSGLTRSDQLWKEEFTGKARIVKRKSRGSNGWGSPNKAMKNP